MENISELNYLVRESSIFKENKNPLVSEIVAAFRQPHLAVKFADGLAKHRQKYDKHRPYEIAVLNEGKAFNTYYNFERLHND